MSEFHNPYHFIPLGSAVEGDLPFCKVENGEAEHVTHDRFTKNAYSGRIVCRLTTVDPLVIGGRQSRRDDGNTVVRPFEVAGRPAIPSTTIRGLISSLAEAASNSALRILGNKAFSYRMSMHGEPLSAIGMVVIEKGADDKPVRKLRPLTYPQLTRSGTEWSLPANFAALFEKPGYQHLRDGTNTFMKVYLAGYQLTGTGKEERLEFQQESFLYQTDAYSTCADFQQFWYLRLPAQHRLERSTLSLLNPRDAKLQEKRGSVLLGQKYEGEGEELDDEGYAELSPRDKRKYTRGILRVLGLDHRETEFPTKKPGKKKEIFIPFPEGAERWPVIPISDKVWAAFHDMADERTASIPAQDLDEETDPPIDKAAQLYKRRMSALPFSLRGSQRNDFPNDRDGTPDDRLRLRNGDLAFFDVDRGGNEVTEISVSSIWRRAAWRCHDYFKAVSPDLVPFNPDRQNLTVAEAIFGVVEERPADEHKAPGEAGPAKPSAPDKRSLSSRSLASRLRFSAATIANNALAPFYHGDPNDPATGTMLQILASPKTPCPSLYFTRETAPRTPADAYIARPDLKPGVQRPLGRKVYLHRYGRPAAAENAHGPWETARPADQKKQKAIVWPIRQGKEFFFHAEFENLSLAELQLLCFALAPDDDFHHKLGLGKPLGLGTVRIEPLGIFFIDRISRASSDSIFRSRYHGGSVSGVGARLFLTTLQHSYFRERAILPIKTSEFPTFVELRDGCVVDDAIRNAFRLLGHKDPANPVSYPREAHQAEPEDKLFSWCVNNDDLHTPSEERQGLMPITAETKVLPTLKTNRKP